MKNKNILTLVLLFIMSFQVVHAFAIEMLDTNECHISEYVGDSSYIVDVDSDDICKLHAAFHHSFIVPEATVLKRELFTKETPSTLITSYDYDATKNFLIPPRIS